MQIINKLFFMVFLCCFSKGFGSCFLTTAGGFSGVFHQKYAAGIFYVECKPDLEKLKISPLLGAQVNTGGSFYGYFGLDVNVTLCKKIMVFPTLAAGYFYKGKGKNLGFPLEFRSGIKIGYIFDNAYQMGFHFFHMSNASLSNKNPGEESLLFFFGFPI